MYQKAVVHLNITSPCSARMFFWRPNVHKKKLIQLWYAAVYTLNKLKFK